MKGEVRIQKVAMRIYIYTVDGYDFCTKVTVFLRYEKIATETDSYTSILYYDYENDSYNVLRCSF